ncbi:hypothetical protein PHLGIDRAFT_20282 [Phlebiopsis gigantea 11061_1 CR5-6]|uniref:Uncharacterized protein n=1 Tax=Phlebiopsis gigantea (strain 11061_1 CR5-6) TaxID=745531 RepID=A0A0C3PDB8_PHLG1|nr:hypothetical protein PHLGIDRAFT_20282 [Phlebiopsis gigantea 11061_1 CR5-6]
MPAQGDHNYSVFGFRNEPSKGSDIVSDDIIVFKLSVECPRDGCNGNVRTPVLLGGFSLSNQEKSNTYVDTSSKRGVCDKCGKMAKVAVQMTATAEAVDQQAKAAS